MKAIASSAVAYNLLEGNNYSGISEFVNNCGSHSINASPCYQEHMVWHYNRMLNPALTWLKWKVRDLFMNILLSHTMLKIGLCVEAQTQLITARLGVSLWCSLDWVTLNLAWLVGKFLASIWLGFL